MVRRWFARLLVPVLALGLLTGAVDIGTDGIGCPETSGPCASDVVDPPHGGWTDDGPSGDDVGHCEAHACDAHSPEHAHGHGSAPARCDTTPPPRGELSPGQMTARTCLVEVLAAIDHPPRQRH